MIKKWFPNAQVVSSFKALGISNVIQACSDNDILFIRAKNKNQLDKLIEINLSNSFKGLVVSPFKPNRSDFNYSVLSIDEMDSKEAELMDYFYPITKKGIKQIGVTGTNGKTSSCWYCMQLGREIGVNVLYMGTIGVFLSGRKLEEKILTTTPSLLSLRKLLYKYGNETDVVALEVSSHALKQKRINGIEFDVVAWTNFTQDHLDYHGTMQDYFEAKLKIIEYSRNKELVVSRNQEELLTKLQGKSELIPTVDLSTTDLKIPNHLKEGFSLSNLEMAFTCLSQLHEIEPNIDLHNLDSPPGRFEIVEKENVLFVIDYAHTPDALEKVLEQASRLYPGLSIITVFGCGGDRDNTKRPMMLHSALKLSQKVIVTSDNPRTENPEDIIKDIVKGNEGVHTYVDRREAIEESYKLAKSLPGQERTIVLIAGKGDENYQEIHGVRHEFSDIQVVKGL